jgi:hypothetical protein
MPKTGVYQRLAEYVATDRARRGYRSRAAFARDIGLGKRTLDKIETGVSLDHRPRTVAAIEAGLGWAPGSFQRVIEGGPRRVPDEQLASLIELWPRLPKEARAMLLRLAREATETH